MDFRDASVVIDESKLIRAVSAQLGATLLLLNATDEYFESPLLTIKVDVDDEVKTFYLTYVMMEDYTISGVILTRTLIKSDEDFNELMHLFVRFSEEKVVPLQMCGIVSERYAVANKAEITAKGIEVLLG